MSLDVPMPDLPHRRLHARRTPAPPAPPTRGTKRRPASSPPPATKRARTAPPAKKRCGDAPGARAAKRLRTTGPASAAARAPVSAAARAPASAAPRAPASAAPRPKRRSAGPDPAPMKRRSAGPEPAPLKRRRGPRIFTVGLGDDGGSDGEIAEDVEEIFDASGAAPTADAPVEPQVHAAVLETGQVLVHVRHADGTLQRIVVEKPV